MLQIAPVHSIEYAPTSGVDFSSVIAAPYKILGDRERAQFLARNPYNILAIDLAHQRQDATVSDDPYRSAATRLHSWIADGILARRSAPSIHLYRQRYRLDEETRVRYGLFVTISIAHYINAETSRGIHPHEQTFNEFIEHRLKLTQATQTQLSPIFGVYSDENEQCRALIKRLSDDRAADRTGFTEEDHAQHELWTVEDPQIIGQFSDLLAPKEVLIADGHHRFSAALRYRDRLAQSAANGKLPDDHPANFCLFTLVALEDPGMRILPTHRALGGMSTFSFAKLIDSAHGTLSFATFPCQELGELEAELPKHGPHAMGVYVADDNRFWIVTPSISDPLKHHCPHRSLAWRQLDVAIIQEYLVGDLCQRFCGDHEVVRWNFTHTLDGLKSSVDSAGFQLGILVQPPSLKTIYDIALGGELLPPKSTFFYPKIPSGLVLNAL